MGSLLCALLAIKKTDINFKITDLKQTQLLPKNRPKTNPAAKNNSHMYNIVTVCRIVIIYRLKGLEPFFVVVIN